jgi:hypothetical protein
VNRCSIWLLTFRGAVFPFLQVAIPLSSFHLFPVGKNVTFIEEASL